MRVRASLPPFVLSESKMKKPSWHELRSSREVAAVCALAFAAACTGALGDSVDDPGGSSGGDDGPSTGSAPPAFQPAAGMLRRLTRTQFRNAVRDVFGVEVDVNQLDSDSWNGNFAVIGATTVVTSERGVEQYHTAIEKAVDAVFADSAKRDQFIGCTPSGAQDDACARGFIEALGLRAWRRPLESAEVDRLAAVANKAATELESAVEGVRWATVALFTSPNFLYRPELGAPSADGSLRLTGYEMASRLAFLVWNSLPDKELLDQAASGELATVEGVRAAATRLLEAPAGREAVGAFAEEYMRLDRIGTQAKDAELFPEYDAALQAAMVRDVRGTWEVLAFDDQASALDLFSTTKVVVNTELAQLYGLDTTGLSSSTFEVRSLPADSPRVGILGKAGFLSQFANQKEGSPTLRGKFLREALMCEPVQPPPGNIALELPEPPADRPLTKRQRLENHRTAPACAACHAYMDPLGLPLETFDAVGRYRTTDHGLPIDPSGDFDGAPVADARELGTTVSASDKVARCLVRKYYAYAAGHEERAVDGSVVNTLAASFEASGFALRELVLDVVTNQAFSAVAPQP
ncbi:DUF1592 domain-containing protein [Sorangium sp. So ce388]|uniref:DUF1592 domain-containing protein n=1 Tax=Sorangium sp. So ce388 TaxID=3133309 RepID=UPI003F5B6D42